MKRHTYIYLLIITLFFCHCDRGSIFPPEPLIEYVSVNQTFLDYKVLEPQARELVITFQFRDGDGDLGNADENQNEPNLLVKDNRPEFSTNPNNPYASSIPFLPKNSRKPLQQGTISVTYTPTTPTPTKDSTTFTIYIYDQAGNKSNEITTPMIYLTR
ncbi:MAG: hypothetical protein ACKVTZ_13750 [Bacteroidia bacterium]